MKVLVLTTLFVVTLLSVSFSFVHSINVEPVFFSTAQNSSLLSIISARVKFSRRAKAKSGAKPAQNPRRLCAYCSKPTECASKNCISGRCVKKGPNADALREARDCSPHLSACASCRTGRSCSSGICIKGICGVSGVRTRSESLRICQGNLPECSKCLKKTGRNLCAKGMSCWQGRCVKIGNAVVKNASIRKCFPHFGECALCMVNSQCRSGACAKVCNAHGACVRRCVVPDDKVSVRKCGGQLDACEKCESGRQCRSGVCDRGLCLVSGVKRAASRKICKGDLLECDRCPTEKTVVKTCSKGLKCFAGKCVRSGFGAIARLSVEKCFPYFAECSICTRSSQCRSGLCKKICTEHEETCSTRCVLKNDILSPLRCSGLLPACSACTSGRQCLSQVCDRGSCAVSGVKRRVSERMCAGNLQECEACPSSSKCASGMYCLNGKCVKKGSSQGKSNSSVRKCFPNFGECSICTSNSQCRSGICHKSCHEDQHGFHRKQCTSRCISRTNPITSAQRCFGKLPACSKCSSFQECLSRRCHHGSCAVSGVSLAVSLRICAGNLPECATCPSNAQCSSGHICVNSKCVVQKPSLARKSSIIKCFPNFGECSLCTAHAQCRSGLCASGRCVLRSPFTGISRRRCDGRLRPCEACKKDRECLSERCFIGKCAIFSGSKKESIRQCKGSLHECSDCPETKFCGQGLSCLRGKCIFRNLSKIKVSLRKCFPNLQACAKCTKSSQCNSVAACAKGRCVPADPIASNACRLSHRGLLKQKLLLTKLTDGKRKKLGAKEKELLEKLLASTTGRLRCGKPGANCGHKRPFCARCKSDHQCTAGAVCFAGRCLRVKRWFAEGLWKCFGKKYKTAYH